MFDPACILDSVAVGCLGFLGGIFWRLSNRHIRIRASKWFWNPQGRDRITIHLGQRSGLLSSEGEIEPMVHLADAYSAFELQKFLRRLYKEVLLVADPTKIDWQEPVVTLGGPVSNPITAELEQDNRVPIQFLDIPYRNDSSRILGTRDRTSMFYPSPQGGAGLASDVAYLARLSSPRNTTTHLYVMAGAYGVGTRGAVQYALSVRNLFRLRWFSGRQGVCFQQVVQVHMDGAKLRTEAITPALRAV